MKIKEANNYLLAACFFIVPTIVWTSHFHPFVAMKDFLFTSFVLISATLLAISFIIKEKFYIKKSKISLGVLLFFVYGVISFFLFPYTDRNYFFIFTCYVLLFFVVSYRTAEKQRDWIINVLIFVSLLSSIYAVLQFLGIDHPFFINYFGSRTTFGTRAFAFFGNPNLLGGFCTIMIPLVTAYLIQSILQKKKVKVYYLGIILVLTITALFMSQTRGSWIATTLSMVIFSIILTKNSIIGFYNAHKSFSVAVIIIAILGLIMGILALRQIPAAYSKQSTSLLSPSTVDIRGNYYLNTINMILERPILGRGIGTFNVYYPACRDNRVVFKLGETDMEYRNMEHRVEHPHNEHLEILSDLGITGYIFFIFIIIQAISTLIRKKNIIASGIAISIMGILIDGLMSQNLRFTSIGSILWLLIGCSNIGIVKESSSKKFNAVKALIAVIPVLIMFFGIRSSYSVMAANFYDRAGMGYYLSNEQNKYENAIRQFELALSKDKYDKRALYYIGASYKITGDSENAIKYYSQLLALDPYFIQTNYFLATLYLDKGDNAKAKQHLSAQIKTNNMYYKAYYTLAYIYNAEGNKHEAIKNLEEINTIFDLGGVPQKQYIEFNKLLADLYVEVKDYKKALYILNKRKLLTGDTQTLQSIKAVKEMIEVGH